MIPDSGLLFWATLYITHLQYVYTLHAIVRAPTSPTEPSAWQYLDSGTLRCRIPDNQTLSDSDSRWRHFLWAVAVGLKRSVNFF